MSTENADLLNLAQHGNEDARNLHFDSIRDILMAFAYKVCKRSIYTDTAGHFSQRALLSDVFLVYLEAVKNFNPDRGASFTSYFTSLFRFRQIDINKTGREFYLTGIEYDDGDVLSLQEEIDDSQPSDYLAVAEE